MVVQIHYTDSDVRSFFEMRGFKVEPRTFGNWRTAYHNREEWHEYEADAVVIGKNHVEATVLLQNVMNALGTCMHVMQLSPTKKMIQTQFKQLLK